MKIEKTFLFAEIDDETLSNILKMKKFINSLEFYISTDNFTDLKNKYILL